MSSEALPPISPEPLLRVQNLAKTYIRRGGLVQPGARVEAVKGVSFTLDAVTTLGLSRPPEGSKYPAVLAHCLRH